MGRQYKTETLEDRIRFAKTRRLYYQDLVDNGHTRVAHLTSKIEQLLETRRLLSSEIERAPSQLKALELEMSGLQKLHVSRQLKQGMSLKPTRAGLDAKLNRLQRLRMKVAKLEAEIGDDIQRAD